MPAVKLIPSERVLARWVDEGLTHSQIADRVHQETGNKVARSTVSSALHRAGLSEDKHRYSKHIPWRVLEKHNSHYALKMLRLMGRKDLGIQLTRREHQLLTAWLRKTHGYVVAYSPDSGVHIVPATMKDHVGHIPVRRTILTPTEVKAYG